MIIIVVIIMYVLISKGAHLHAIWVRTILTNAL